MSGHEHADAAAGDGNTLRAEPNVAGLYRYDDGTFLSGRSSVGNCFGCGPSNDRGLQLRFRLLDDDRVATTVEVPAYLCGVDGIVHGGIQTTILDEVSGVAAQLWLPDGSSDAPCVTAELAVRFRRPVSQRGPVTAVARVLRREGRSLFVEAAIVDDDGSELTTASSRWVQLT